MLALTFQMGTDRVALDVKRVRRVVPRVKLSPSSLYPVGVVGVFVYRGQVVPVVDLYRLAGAEHCPQRLSSRIILVPFLPDSDRLVGLLATEVAEIREVAAPTTLTESAWKSGLGPPQADGASVIRVFDPDRLLSSLDLAPAVFQLPGGAGL